MRLILILLACGTALLGCDEPDASMMTGPEPEAGQPEAPEPDAPEPQPDAPEPEPEPDYGPAPEPGDGAMRGVATLLVQVSGDNAFAEGGTLIATPITADGERLPSLSAPMNLYPVQMDWQVQRWWPLEAIAAVAQVEIEVHDGEQLLRAETVSIAELPVVETGCDPAGFANRCAEGSTCFFVNADSAGGCDPIDARIWGHTERMHFDLRADRGTQAQIAQPTLLRADAIERVIMRGAHDGRWRAVGNLWREGGTNFPLFIGPHRHDAAAPVEVPPTRSQGERCDILRLADACAEGNACNEAGVCIGVTAPTLTQAEFITRDGVAGLWLEGIDPDGDVDRIVIHRGDGTETVRRLYAYDAHDPLDQGGVEFDAEGRFEALWMTRRDDVPNGVIRVQAVDVEGLRSPIQRISVLGAPKEGVALGICDDAGLIVACPAGTGCDLHDGERQFTCQPLDAECSAPERFEAFVGESMSGANTGPDATTNSCHRSRGNAGQEAGYIVTAERTGRHTFTADSAAYGVLGSLAIRRVCHLSGAETSELACAPDMSQGNGAESLTLDADLEAGETVYVVVESHWVGGGPFQLTVSRP